MALRGEARAKLDTTGVEDANNYDVSGMIGARYGLSTVGFRIEFCKKSAKDPMHARLLMPVLEGNNDTAATKDLDDVLENLDAHMATELMKAAASLHASNAVKRSGDGGASYRYTTALFPHNDPSFNSESMRGGSWERQTIFVEPSVQYHGETHDTIYLWRDNGTDFPEPGGPRICM
jgi:hypothetical protein